MRFSLLLFVILRIHLEIYGQNFKSNFYPEEISNTTIIIKANLTTDKNGSTSNTKLNAFLRETNGELKAVFPQHRVEKSAKGAFDLSNIYQITYPYPTDAITLSKQISNMPNVIYAEPMILPRLCFTPSDSLISRQY